MSSELSHPRRLHRAEIVLGALDNLREIAIAAVVGLLIGGGAGGMPPLAGLMFAANAQAQDQGTLLAGRILGVDRHLVVVADAGIADAILPVRADGHRAGALEVLVGREGGRIDQRISRGGEPADRPADC